jgi:hypothetical protein
MQASTVPTIVILWFGAIFVVNGVGGLYFWFGRNADDKRQLFPWFSALTAILFLGFVYFAVGAPAPVLAFVAVLLTIGTVAHVRLTVFCPRCARMIYRSVLSARVSFCPRCGLALDRAPNPSATL